MKRMIVVWCLLASVCLSAEGVTVADISGLEADQPDLERLVLGIEGKELALELVLNAESLGVERRLQPPAQAVGGDVDAMALDSKHEEVRGNRVARVVGQLFDVSNIVSIPPEAGCVGSSSSAKQETIAGIIMVKTEHALNCLKPELIDVIEVNIFDLAPSLETLEVELVSQTNMSSLTVTPGKAMVSVIK